MAQTCTLMEGYGDPLTLDQFKALAGTNGRFAFVASSNTAGETLPRCDRWVRFTSTHSATLADDALFYLEASGANYLVKRASDNQYVITNSSATSFGASGTPFKLVNRDPNDATKAVTGSQSISFQDPSNSSYNYNVNAVKMNTGQGAWTTYAVFGPIYKNITIDCQQNGSSLSGYPQQSDYQVGGTINAPVIVGLKQVDNEPTSVTIDQDDMTITFNYVASTYDYNLVVNNAPAGATISIKGDDVTNATTYSSADAVAESDVVVTFSSEQSYMTSTVTISGTTITINCEDTRWPINFSKDQKYTRTNRFIDNVRIGSKVFAITNDGLNTPAYRDLTSDVLIVPAGATLVPAIGYQGAWMHGFFYVDLDNDGQFYVANPDHITPANTEYNGELLSYGNEGNALNASHQEMPAFVMPTTPGDYRARFKLDWASTDPGGNPGADINNVNSDNHIIKNGGTIVDITLRILPPADVTYVVVDEDNNELYRATETVGSGETITTLPNAYQQSAFYTYSTVNQTVTTDTEITFTATKKTDAPIQFTADATNPVWNYLKLKNANYPTYVAGGTPNVTLPETNAYDETVQWAFIGNPYAGFQIINKAAGTSLVLGSASAAGDGNTGGNTYATLAAPGSQMMEKWFVSPSTLATNGFFLRNAEGHALNQRSTDNLAYWINGADLGSTFVATLPATAYDALIAQLEAYPYGTGLNEYSLVVEGQDFTTQATTIISGLKTQGYTAENLTNAQLMLSGTSLNMPTAGFYRIKSAALGTYVTSTLDASVSYPYNTYFTDNADASDPGTIWYYTADNKLLNYATGVNSNSFSAAAVGGAYGVAFDFQAATNGVGKYWVHSSDNKFWYAGNPTLDNYSAPRNVSQTLFELEEVTELPFTISAAGQATLALPTAWEVPTGVTVRYASTEHDGLLTVEDADASVTAIAADEAVILVGTPGDYTITLAASGETLGSILTSTGGGVNVPAETKAYILALNGENQVVFALLNDSERDIVAFKAYYISTAAGAAPAFLLFEDGTVTGINAVNAAAQNGAAVYDLQGRRVSNAQKGVYIVNGQKVLVK